MHAATHLLILMIVSQLAMLIGFYFYIRWLRGSWKARGYGLGYSAGKSDGIAANGAQVRMLQNDLAMMKQARQIERRAHQNALEQTYLEADERVATYAARSNPFTEQNLKELIHAATKLELAANTYAGLYAGDEAQLARKAATTLLNMAETLTKALSTQAKLEAAA